MNLFHTTLTRFGEEFLACTKQTISTIDGGVDSIQREARGVGGGIRRTLGEGRRPEAQKRHGAHGKMAHGRGVQQGN